MPEGLIILFLICTVLLAGIAAFRIAMAVSASLCKRGSGWSWAAGILTFCFCFASFFIGMAMVFGMFFGR